MTALYLYAQLIYIPRSGVFEKMWGLGVHFRWGIHPSRRGGVFIYIGQLHPIVTPHLGNVE
jgi:hypothetical protein